MLQGTVDAEMPEISAPLVSSSIAGNTITQEALATGGTPEVKAFADPETDSVTAESMEDCLQDTDKQEGMDVVADKTYNTEKTKGEVSEYQV